MTTRQTRALSDNPSDELELPDAPVIVDALARSVRPALESARSALACILGEGHLPAEQRLQLKESRALIDAALGDLAGLERDESDE